MCRFISIALDGTAGFYMIGPGAPWVLAQITQKHPHPYRQCLMRPRCSLKAPPSCASISTRSTGGHILANSACIPDRALILLRQTGSILNSGISGWPRYPRSDLRSNACFWDDRSNDDQKAPNSDPGLRANPSLVRHWPFHASRKRCRSARSARAWRPDGPRTAPSCRSYGAHPPSRGPRSARPARTADHAKTSSRIEGVILIRGTRQSETPATRG